MLWCILRNDILLLLDLKSACDAYEFELQSLKHRHDILPLDKQSSISLPGKDTILQVNIESIPPHFYLSGPHSSDNKECELYQSTWHLRTYDPTPSSSSSSSSSSFLLPSYPTPTSSLSPPLPSSSSSASCFRTADYRCGFLCEWWRGKLYKYSMPPNYIDIQPPPAPSTLHVQVPPRYTNPVAR